MHKWLFRSQYIYVCIAVHNISLMSWLLYHMFAPACCQCHLLSVIYWFWPWMGSCQMYPERMYRVLTSAMRSGLGCWPLTVSTCLGQSHSQLRHHLYIRLLVIWWYCHYAGQSAVRSTFRSLGTSVSIGCGYTPVHPPSSGWTTGTCIFGVCS